MAELFKLMGTIAIDATDATQKIDAVITAGADLEAKLNGIGANAESYIGSTSGFNTAAVWMGNMLTELTTKAVEFGKSLWNTGFNMNLSEESWIASFKTYLGGDLEEAAALVERLKQFAIDTPLSMQEVMAQATQLLATGTAPEKLIEVLGMLGDISRGDMSYFSRISTAYWQIMTTGKLLAQDANQLTQAGVPVWQLVADYFNTIERDGRTDWTKGMTKSLATQAALQQNPDLAISSDELYAALMFSTSETGMYFNAMNNAMETTKGKLEKLNDAFTLFAASLTEPFADVMGTETLDKMAESFDRFTAWAEENPDVLNNLATALSDVATNGLNVLLGGLQNLLTFWNENQDLFNGMMMVLGGIAIKSGHPAAGMALLTAGGYNVWDDWVKENQKAFSGLTSDVDLPFIKQQLEYQGQGAQWEAYLENWKNSRRAEGYSNEDINGFIENQFANYKSLTNEELQKMFGGGSADDGKSLLDWLFPGFSWIYDQFNKQNDSGDMSGSLRWLQENMHNTDMLYASTGGKPDGKSEDSDRGTVSTLASGILSTLSSYGRETARFGASSVDFDNAATTAASIQALAATVQSLAGEVRSLTGTIPEAIASGISGITVTGHVSTGNVTLNTGALVGYLTPSLNLALGSANKYAARGVR